MLIRIPPSWHIPEREATAEGTYLTRRSALGLLALAACAPKLADHERRGIAATIPAVAPPYPAPRNGRFTLDRPLTDPLIAAGYNNFYELTAKKDVWRRADRYRPGPWTLEVTGAVARPMRLTLDDLTRQFQLEERLYRLRCVEAWSIAVPWTGFPLARLLARAEPTAAARFVRFVSLAEPAIQPGLSEQQWYPWPYHEALRMDEAMHDLTMVVTGIYGHALPAQHGAPLRIVVPWKYGYKSPKAVVRIEVTERQPPTFWSSLQAVEYPFESNVDPSQPHPRWSQLTEKSLSNGAIRRTLALNGYAKEVGHLY